MPNENEKMNISEPQNPPPDKIDDIAKVAESTGSKKGLFSAMFNIFKNLLPAIKDAFAAGTTAFKRRIQGIPEPEQSSAKEQQPKDALPSIEETQGEGGGGEKSLPQQQADFSDSKQGTGSKSQKFLVAFLIALIIIISVGGGLYLGGMFDKEKDVASESGKSVSAPPQKDEHKKSLFDSIFGKKNPHPATPKEQLAAMQITYNPNNFIKYAGQNNLPVVKLFIKSGMHPDTRRPLDGFTPLTAAAVFGRPKMAEFLLDVNGADINAKDNDGQTALMKAVRHNHPEMVELLLKRNADYKIADKQGNTALTLAKEHYGDNPLTKAFEKFSIDISGDQKEPVKEEPVSKEPVKKELPVPPPQQGKSSPQKQSQYMEISVEEFLKTIQSAPKQ